MRKGRISPFLQKVMNDPEAQKKIHKSMASNGNGEAGKIIAVDVGSLKYKLVNPSDYLKNK